MAEHDILIITDSTGSMSTYLRSLRTSLPEIIGLINLSGSFKRLGVLAYTDYSLNRDVISWSGWDAPNIADFTANLNPVGNHDTPEASKTALIRALDEVDGERKTVILWYTDAPPHHASEMDYNTKYELQAFPNRSTDWVHLSFEAAKNNCTIFGFTDNMADKSMSFWAFLCQATGGACINIRTYNSAEISRVTLDILLAFMRETPVWYPPIHNSIKIVRFTTPPQFANPQPTDEVNGSHGYLPPVYNGHSTLRLLEKVNMTDFSLIPTWAKVEGLELAKRFSNLNDSIYRATVFSSLAQLIEHNVGALTYNPIFGTLWRAVCKERLNEQRDHLVNLFSQKVSSISDADRREAMKAWLEASYDSSGDIEALIETAPDHGEPTQRRMYLDLDSDIHLTRMEILEVARSCYPAVVQKVATMLTHAKILEPGVTLTPRQRSIPLSLPPSKLFQILPHLVVPGTMFSNRAAAIMAVLALAVGVPFLEEQATGFLEGFRGSWLNVEIPENLSYECAKLLLSTPQGVTLNDEERNAFDNMRRYRLLELNLGATLIAKVPWNPEKSRGVGDRMVMCSHCKIKRSVTMMRADVEGLCGMCFISDEYISSGGRTGAQPKDPSNYPNDKGELDSCWVECSVKTCRAQYVIQDVAGLNVRPKCHYCRNGEDCPFVQCTLCLNRIILPSYYRVEGQYSCPACESAEMTMRQTVVNMETSTRDLIVENGTEWLGLNPNPDIFLNKSAFKLFSTHGLSFFEWKRPQQVNLNLNSKPIHNEMQLMDAVENWVGTGKIEYGTCSLCFEDQPYPKLMPACGRSGCKQRVDEACLGQWYGGNEVGKLLNLMRLTCPFCRRRPTVKTMARFNKAVASLAGLQDALADPRFFYAWCGSCQSAKRAVERVCCDDDHLPAIQDFCCEGCIQERAALRTRLEAEGRALREQAEMQTDVQRRLGEIDRRVTALEVDTVAGPIRITPCPQCGAFVEKTFGCNHIECQCGAHFCHVCGIASDVGDIYEHMSNAHGGFYDEDLED